MRNLAFFPLAALLVLAHRRSRPVRQLHRLAARQARRHGQLSHFTANPNGYDSTSLVRVAMQGLNYALSKTERLSSANQLATCS